MFKLYKSPLTRRLFILFLGLSVIPTLLVIILPSVNQIRKEEQALNQLESELSTKAEDIFTSLSDHKADTLHQALDSRMRQALGLVKVWDGSDMPRKEMEAIAVEIVGQDPAFLQMSLAPATIVDSESSCLQYRETVETSADLRGWTYYVRNEKPILATCLEFDHSTLGTSGFTLEYDLAKLTSEIPRYGLAESAFLVLVDEHLGFISAPDWAYQQGVIKQFDPAQTNLHHQRFDQLLSTGPFLDKTVRQIQNTLEKEGKLLLYQDYEDQGFYYSFQRIADTPLVIALVLPFDEVVNRAEYFGASLSVEVAKILQRTAVSIAGLVIVIALGAWINLRDLVYPIQNLAKSAEQVAQGDLETEIKVSGYGELRELGEVFNEMVQEIVDKQIELRRLLTQREKELGLFNQISYIGNQRMDLFDRLEEMLSLIRDEMDIPGLSLYLLRNDEVIPFVRAGEIKGAAPCSTQFEQFERQAANQAHIALIDADREDLEFHVLPVEFNRKGGKSCLMLPVGIQFREMLKGILIVYGERDQLCSESMQSFLKSLSDHLGIIMEISKLQSQSRFLVVANERRRLARELHDSVTQTLYSMSLAIDSLDMEALGVPPKAQDTLEFVKQQSVRTRKDMRALINELRPYDLGRQDLEDAIKAHLDSIKHTTDIRTEVEIQGWIEQIPGPIQYNLDRIIQEAISNIVQHSKTEDMKISLQVEKEHLQLMIEDHGIGFDQESSPREDSLGLLTMKERSDIMGGALQIYTQKGEGVKIIVGVPLVRESKKHG